MNTILIEDYRVPVGSVVEETRKLFPPTSIVFCNRKTVEDVTKKTLLPPVFSKNWLVIVNAKDLPDNFILRPTSSRDHTIYVCRSSQEGELLWRRFKSLSVDFILVDNLNLSKEVLLQYVLDNLNISRSVAEFLVSRTKNSATKIANAVDLLDSFPVVTKNDVTRYIRPSTELSFSRMFEYIIGQPPQVNPDLKFTPVIKHSKVVSLIKQYEYAPWFIMKYLVERFEQYLSVYDHASLGLLDLENYKSYLADHPSEFKNISEYTAYRALDSMRYVSYGALYHLYLLYKKESVEGPRLINILALLRLSRR